MQGAMFRARFLGVGLVAVMFRARVLGQGCLKR